MTLRKKNILLILGFIAMFFIAYKFAFSNTFELKKQLNEMQSRVNENNQLIPDIQNIGSRELYLDSIIEINRGTRTSGQNNLINILNNSSDSLKIKIDFFKEPHTQKGTDSTDTIITSYNFALEGNYNSIERILYIIETKSNIGKIDHIKFQEKKNYKQNRLFLRCEVLLRDTE